VKVLVTGAGGMLAHALIDVLAERSHEVAPFTRGELDVTDAQRVHDVVAAEQPDAVVHCAAYSRVDDAEHAEDSATRINADGARHTALACRQVGARFVYPSTDYVFDGTARVPYPPDAPTAPLGAYGRSKLAGELAARATDDALIVRTSWLYAAHGRNFVRTMLERARAGRVLRVVDDQRGAPTAASDLATMLVLLLERRAPAGVYHATNRGETTWFGLARAALEIAGIAADLSPTTSAEFPQVARRPAYSVLDCSSTYAITGPAPHWRDALATVIGETIQV
jgi:dTDP-4-dehydrorhamnose reductase